MILYQCDICNKNLKEKEVKISAGFGDGWRAKLLCLKCAEPIADFLNKHGFGKGKSKKS